MNLQFCVSDTKTNSVYPKALAKCLVQPGTMLGTRERMNKSHHCSLEV